MFMQCYAFSMLYSSVNYWGRAIICFYICKRIMIVQSNHHAIAIFFDMLLKGSQNKMFLLEI